MLLLTGKKRAQIATWSIEQEGRGNSHIAFDEADHRLFVGAINRREPGKVVVLDSDSGKMVTSIHSAGQSFSDDLDYDPLSRRIYLAGVPFANIFQNGRDDGCNLIGQLSTVFHAVTAILVPQLSRYYVAVNHHGSTDAKVQVYETVP